MSEVLGIEKKKPSQFPVPNVKRKDGASQLVKKSKRTSRRALSDDSPKNRDEKTKKEKVSEMVCVMYVQTAVKTIRRGGPKRREWRY